MSQFYQYLVLSNVPVCVYVKCPSKPRYSGEQVSLSINKQKFRKKSFLFSFEIFYDLKIFWCLGSQEIKGIEIEAF